MIEEIQTEEEYNQILNKVDKLMETSDYDSLKTLIHLAKLIERYELKYYAI